jgi:hypothetical protein
MSTWINEDGLQVEFDLSRGPTVSPGGVTGENVHKTLVHKFGFADVAITDVTVPNAREAFIPAGAVITRATIYVTTAWVGATGVLDVGLKNAAGTNTDDDGIVSSAITTIDALGDTLVCDGALVADGDLTAVRLAADQYVMTTYDTAAFTAGAATLVIEYLELEA